MLAAEATDPLGYALAFVAMARFDVSQALAMPLVACCFLALSPGAAYDADGDAVAKWGNWHCGENKERFNGSWTATEPTLFEPFVTTKEVGRGTGLGLAVCRGLVEAAGGSISLDREYTRGARFVVDLPLRD